MVSGGWESFGGLMRPFKGFFGCSVAGSRLFGGVGCVLDALCKDSQSSLFSACSTFIESWRHVVFDRCGDRLQGILYIGHIGRSLLGGSGLVAYRTPKIPMLLSYLGPLHPKALHPKPHRSFYEDL